MGSPVLALPRGPQYSTRLTDVWNQWMANCTPSQQGQLGTDWKTVCCVRRRFKMTQD